MDGKVTEKSYLESDDHQGKEGNQETTRGESGHNQNPWGQDGIPAPARK